MKVNGGALEIEDHDGCTIWYRPRLTAPVEIEYKVLLTPNATDRIRLVARDGEAEFWRDGRRIFFFKDSQPLQSGWFGIRTVNSHLRISRFRVHAPARR